MDVKRVELELSAFRVLKQGLFALAGVCTESAPDYPYAVRPSGTMASSTCADVATRSANTRDARRAAQRTMTTTDSPRDVDERTLRTLRGDLVAVDRREMAPLLAGTVDSVVLPAAPSDRARLALDLLDLYETAVGILHEREAEEGCACARRCWTEVASFVTWRDRDPRAAFRHAVEAFFEVFGREHPAGPEQLASWAIRQEPARTWTIAALSRLVGTRPRHLRLAFGRRFGMRVSGYVHLVRAGRALNLLAVTSKIDAVAYDAGYRSKKDLYRALAQWTGGTPTELRALSIDERAWLERELRIRIVHGTGRHPTADAPAISGADGLAP